MFWFWTILTLATGLLAGLFGWHIGGHAAALAFTLGGILAVLGAHDLKKHRHSLLAGTAFFAIVGWYFGGVAFAVLTALLAFPLQLAIWEFSLKKSVVLPILLLGSGTAWWMGWHLDGSMTGLVAAALTFFAMVGIEDYFLQRKHSVRRNFPILGWCRYGFELIGDELRQYWFMSDIEEKPYNRETRRFIYRSAKGINNNLGFGSSRDYRAVGEIHIMPTNFPVSERLHRGNRLPPLVIGKRRRIPYHCPWPINIAHMSWGALSEEAVMALASGAKLANIHMGTGEGGLTPFHLDGVVRRVPFKQKLAYHWANFAYLASGKRAAKPVAPQGEIVGGGRIVLEIGPAKFGFRKSMKDAFRHIGVDFAPNSIQEDDLRRLAKAFYLNGLDMEMLRELAEKDELVALDLEKVKRVMENPQIVAGMLKLAQGAKPGQGGKLPKEKITAKIAQWRGVPMGKDCYSPNAWDEFNNSETLFIMVLMLQELTGKPWGIKIVAGQEAEVHAMAELYKKHKDGPDFIVIDGGEGGTGAAPVDLADHVGLPILHAIPDVDNILRKHGVRDEVVLIAAGQMAKASDVVIAIALGADAVEIGRANMIAEGCIMAKRCHTNHCPVGVATQDPRLRRGLDPEDKYVKVANYNMVLQRGLLVLLKSAGVKSPWELTRHHLKVVMGPMKEVYMDEIHPYPDGSDGKRNVVLGDCPADDPEHNDRFGPKLIQLEVKQH
jgi:glutamate synthase domain-containing protein 2